MNKKSKFIFKNVNKFSIIIIEKYISKYKIKSL